MMLITRSLSLRSFLFYKLFNSVFLGLSVGSIFIIYQPLEPSVYSLGGIFLALAMLAIAKLYVKILNRRSFYHISMGIELLMLCLLVYFLFFSYSYTSAMVIYIGYQVTFAFGSYLVRAETMLLNRARILTFLDVAKQKGYLFGLLFSYLFYKGLEFFLKIGDVNLQVYYLHYLLLLSEVITILYLYRAFHPRPKELPSAISM